MNGTLLATVIIAGIVSLVIVRCWNRLQDARERLASIYSGEALAQAMKAAEVAERRADAARDAHLERVAACAGCPACIATLDYMPEIGDLPE